MQIRCLQATTWGELMTYNLRSAVAVCSSLALACTSAVSMAADWSVTARAETGVQYYHFEQTPTIAYNIARPFPGGSGTTSGTVALAGRDYETWMPILGAGLSFVVDRFFVDASIQTALNGSGSSSGTGVSALSGSSSVDLFGASLPVSAASVGNLQSEGNADFDRLEYAFAAGYAFTDRFAVYAGWKWATTKFDVRVNSNFSTVTSAVIDATAIDFGSVGQTSTERGTQWGTQNYDFEQDGPFIGAAYSWDFEHGLNGSLTVNAAVAYLNGEFKNIKAEVTQCTENGACVYDPDTGKLIGFKGSSTAFTLGLSWRGQTNVRGLTYLLGVNGYSYHFGADSLHNEYFNGTDGGDVNETVLNFKVGLAYAF